MHMEMSNNHHSPKTLFAFKKKDEKAVLAKVKIASRCEQNGVVYATLACSKGKADLSAIKHLLIGAVAGV